MRGAEAIGWSTAVPKRVEVADTFLVVSSGSSRRSTSVATAVGKGNVIVSVIVLALSIA
jgi:hypothetical protein